MTAMNKPALFATDTEPLNESAADSQTAAAGRPLSEVIRDRIQASGQRFHANDNIGEFIEDGEIDELLEEVAGKMKEVLRSLVIDVESDHNTQDTARRVAKMYLK